MKRSGIILIVLFTVLLVVSTGHTFMGQDSAKGMTGPRGMGNKMAMVDQVLKMADYLGLSSEQITKLADLNLDSQINLIKDKAAVEVAELQLKKLMSSYGTDKKAIDDVVDNLYELKKTKKKNMIDTHFKVVAILTTEQFNKLKEFRLTMGKMSKEMRQKRRMTQQPAEAKTQGD